MLPTEAPPESGTIEIELSAAPVSFQATATRKAAVVAALRARIAGCEYVLGGDVTVVIEWRISARARYESAGSADVDNIVKPLLDALCGPAGIMIDDCQVQALTCYWAGSYTLPEDESVRIEVRFDPDEYLLKDGLEFLQVGPASYFPLSGDLPGEVKLIQAEAVVDSLQRARAFAERVDARGAAGRMMPSQRVFHRSRVGAFPITSLEAIRARAAAE